MVPLLINIAWDVLSRLKEKFTLIEDDKHLPTMVLTAHYNSAVNHEIIQKMVED